MYGRRRRAACLPIIHWPSPTTPGTGHRSSPVAGRHEADEPSSKRLRPAGHVTVSDPFAEIADHFAHNNPLSASFSETVCTLGTTPPRVATPPAPGGGIALHEGPTRRRHAVRLPRVAQNPHHCQHGGRTPLTRPSAVPVGAKILAQHGTSNGPCAKKLARRT